MREALYIAVGYLLGSVLFARVNAALLQRGDIVAQSKDGNPGTTNAFLGGGFWCGVLTLCGDILKGMLPVFCFSYFAAETPTGWTLAFVMAAPVLGHIFPLYYRFRGGKGIATTFGVLLGLLPDILPVLILAACFIFFSCVVRISPHYYRTIFTYLTAEILSLFMLSDKAVIAGFTLITAGVVFRLLFSKEKREACKVGLLWMH